MALTSPQSGLLLVFAFGASIIVLLLLFGLYKIRRVHLMAYEIRDGNPRKLDHLYTQLEALTALLLELKLEQGLPPTRGACASPDFLLLMVRHVRKARPATIVECGSGTSTVALARALELNGTGHLCSLEHEPFFAAVTREHLERLGLAHRATVLDAPLQSYDVQNHSYYWYADDVIPNEQIDMLVVDGPPLTIGPMARYPAGPILFPFLNPGAIVFIDDADREDESRMVERWLKDFPYFERSLHQCEKGCITLSFKPGSKA